MKKIPICSVCGQYYVTKDLSCPSCNQKGPIFHVSSRSSSIKEKAEKLFKNNQIQRNEDYIEVHPPPPPPTIIDNEDENNIEAEIHSSVQNSEFTVFRRGLVLIFDEPTFDLITQYSWIKRTPGSSIEIKFKKEFISDEIINTRIKIVLRLNLVFISSREAENIENYLQNANIQDEVRLKISPSYLIIKDSPLKASWYNFITLKNKLKKNIMYLDRKGVLGSNNNNANNLGNVEELFLNFISIIFNINTENNNLSIITEDSPVLILSNNEESIQNIIDNSNSNLPITDVLDSCMGHGGPIDPELISKNNMCSICQGKLCEICVESFLICPGSIFSKFLHKFTT